MPIHDGIILGYMASPAAALALEEDPDATISNPALRKTLRFVSRAQKVIELCAENPETLGVWPLPIKRALDQLTHKQRHFAICIASGMTQMQSYRCAYEVRPGRPDRSMYGEVTTVSNNRLIMNAVSLMNEWLDTKWLLEGGQAIDYGLSLAYEISTTSTDDKTRLRAVETILRVNGAFINRSEVKHIHIDDRQQTAELVSALGDLIGLAQQIVPKPSPQIEQAEVASVEFIDSDSAIQKL